MQPINIQPVLINRERVQEMLGGISRTTFYRKRKQWEQTGTPFPLCNIYATMILLPQR